MGHIKISFWNIRTCDICDILSSFFHLELLEFSDGVTVLLSPCLKLTYLNARFYDIAGKGVGFQEKNAELIEFSQDSSSSQHSQ